MEGEFSLESKKKQKIFKLKKMFDFESVKCQSGKRVSVIHK
jgi:hypothetical protein